MIETLPRAFAGISTGTERVISSPRYVRISVFSVTVEPGLGRLPSIQTRSSVAVFDCSLASISRFRPSMSTSSNALRRRKLIGPTT